MIGLVSMTKVAAFQYSAREEQHIAGQKDPVFRAGRGLLEEVHVV
jgi:hypothetical protein